ncbi:aldose epimerase family protein [Flagellimonas sp. CMM7]|uniref:aldose epimerase family protein n=1 Tax=Flagellimonas sp. CMM7 TaxID=2654676 RepID=UPI0013D401B7|nr:aldose epimerase family protein [Flagellimonas sp. CMM7]UII80376.1 galactose mutarotase [Flagellimonas sp. CMM7]
MLRILISIVILTGIMCCKQKTDLRQPTLLDKTNFSKTLKGKEINLFTLKNSKGTITEITNFGGKVVSLWVADKVGNYDDIVLGYPDIDGFLTAKEKYFGALIGRYGNRIGAGKFTLDSLEYKLATNNGINHLHGGNIGYDAIIWDANQIDDQNLELYYLSKDMEEGYPGNLQIKVQYQLTNKNELKIEYWATTDAPTVVNLTHHSFFNFHGAGNGTINDHLLQINASRYTPIDDGLIPTGELASVEGTPFDFRKAIAIGALVNEENEQMTYGYGYDHNFVLDQSNEELTLAARVKEPVSGRTMEVFTNEPGLQFYGGNFLDGSIIGKKNKTYNYRSAFCLETQHFPDSPNKPDFPSTRLDPGEEYYSVCIYKFLIE